MSAAGPSPPRPLPIALGAALLSAVMYWAAFPSLGWEALAFVCCAPLLNRAPDLPAGRRALVGWVWGTLVHAFVYYWIWHTARSMSQLPAWLSWLVLLGYAGGHGLFGALWLLILGWLARAAGPARFALLAAGSFTCLEAVYPFLFPWFLGDAFYDNHYLVQLADVGGVHLLSFLAVLPAAWLARVTPPHRRLSWQGLRPALIALGSVVVVMAAYGAWRLSTLRPAPNAPSLVAAIVQPWIPGEMKLKREVRDREAILDRTLQADSKLDGLRDGVDVVIWPEGAFPFYFRTKEIPGIPTGRETWPLRYTRRLIDHVKQSGKPLITGTLRRPFEERTRNSATLIEPDGTAEVYDKRLLVAFGERMPFSDVFPWLRGRVPGVSDMKPGEAVGTFEVKGHRLLMHICYETIFPQRVRADVRSTNPAAIINLTNDVWFGETSAPELHLMVQTLRAVETRRTIVRVTNSGISALVDPTGAIVERTPVYEAWAGTWTVPLWTAPAPWLYLGDAVLYALAAACLALGIVGRRTKGAGARSR